MNIETKFVSLEFVLPSQTVTPIKIQDLLSIGECLDPLLKKNPNQPPSSSTPGTNNKNKNVSKEVS